MKKNSKKKLEEPQKLNIKNSELHKQLRQHIQKAKDTVDLINTGSIDALVIPNKKDLKVYTETTADKTYRVLIEKMNEGAVTLDKDGTILFSNSSFANMVNLPLQKVTGAKFINFIDNSSKESFKSLATQGLRSDLKAEGNIISNDGKVIPTLLSMNALQLEKEFVLSIIITDIFFRHKIQVELELKTKQLEQKYLELESVNKELAFQNQEKEKRADELSIANKELAFQNQEKEKRAEELTIANKDLTTFTFVSSHDLQEPLRKIKNFINVLLEEEEKQLSDDGKNYLQRMYETANGMQVLIEDLLSYARAKGGKRKFEKTDLAIIVEEVKKDFEEVINKNKATIEIGELCVANIIRFQFHQLFQNLISNSFKFSKPDIAPHIIIKSEITDGGKLNNEKLVSKVNYCHITYTDNGIGFDPQYNDRIFEVFQRLNSKDEYEGTGMGLAICKRIIENHDGIITAEGELNKGARFDIYIPAK
jgi:PAS domain S-box-containing protein